MKTCKPMLLTAMTLFAALAITVQASAQNHVIAFDAAAKAKITTFDAPGAGKGAGQGTFPYGINPAGAIAGFDIDSGGVFHGILRAPGGSITKFDAAGAGKTAAMAPSPTASTGQARSPGNTMTPRTCFTVSCVLQEATSKSSTLRGRALPTARAL